MSCTIRPSGENWTRIESAIALMLCSVHPHGDTCGPKGASSRMTDFTRFADSVTVRADTPA